MYRPSPLPLLPIVVIILANCMILPVTAKNCDSPIAQLLIQMKDPKPTIRVAAAQQLVGHVMGNRYVILPLLAVMRDPDPAVRKYAARAARSRGRGFSSAENREMERWVSCIGVSADA